MPSDGNLSGPRHASKLESRSYWDALASLTNLNCGVGYTALAKTFDAADFNEENGLRNDAGPEWDAAQGDTNEYDPSCATSAKAAVEAGYGGPDAGWLQYQRFSFGWGLRSLSAVFSADSCSNFGQWIRNRVHCMSYDCQTERLTCDPQGSWWTTGRK